LQFEVFQTADSRLILAEDPPLLRRPKEYLPFVPRCEEKNREREREREEKADTEFPGAHKFSAGSITIIYVVLPGAGAIAARFSLAGNISARFRFAFSNPLRAFGFTKVKRTSARIR